MDSKQFESAAELMRCAASVEGECGNLKKRLKLAVPELKGDAAWKPVLVAAALLAKEVDLAYAEIQKVLKIKEKDLLKLEIADFKKKSDRMRVLISTTSDAATNYWAAYRKSYGENAKIGGCVSANSSNEYATRLIKYATDVKIAWNRMK